jgi:hypothetical protein
VAHVASDEPQLTVDEQGVPLWPLRDEEDENACRAVAELFDGRLIEKKPLAGTSQILRPGSVVGIGDIQEEVWLYGHLTGRRALIIESCEELDAIQDPEVIIVVGPTPGLDLARFLSTYQVGPTTPGIIWSPNRDSLRKQVLARAATALLVSPGPIRRVDISGLQRTQYMTSDASALCMGKESSTKSIRESLGQVPVPGVLTILGHGTGWRASMGENAALCSLAADRVNSQTYTDAPPCFYTGECGYFNQSVISAANDGKLVSPKAISARVLLLVACRAGFMGSTTVDFQWGLIRQLITSYQIGVVMAPAQNALIEIADISNELSGALASGSSTGNAAAGHERSVLGKKRGFHLLIFGDPAARAGLPPKDLRVLRRSEPRQKPQISPSSPKVDPDLEVLHLLSRTLPARPDEPELPDEPNARVLQADLLDELLNWETSDTKKVLTLQRKVIAHLASIRAYYHNALVAAAINIETRLESCVNCGWPIYRHIYEYPWGATRSACSCSFCEYHEDIPESVDSLTCTFEAPSFLVEGKNLEDAHAALVLSYSPPEPMGIKEVPVAQKYIQADIPTPTMFPEHPLPYRVRVVVLRQLELWVFGVTLK